MNAVIYARCNSKNQAEYSIEEQIKTCEEYAKEKGYTIIENYVDIGSRKQFEQMIKNSSKNDFEEVIIFSYDRFSRNRYESTINKSKLKRNGVRIYSVKENISDDAHGILLESVVEGMIEYQALEYSRKIKEGIARKKREKERIANEG